MVKSLCFLGGTSTTEDNYQSFLEFGLIIEKIVKPFISDEKIHHL
jgi:hypothetical protein